MKKIGLWLVIGMMSILLLACGKPEEKILGTWELYGFELDGSRFSLKEIKEMSSSAKFSIPNIYSMTIVFKEGGSAYVCGTEGYSNRDYLVEWSMDGDKVTAGASMSGILTGSDLKIELDSNNNYLILKKKSNSQSIVTESEEKVIEEYTEPSTLSPCPGDPVSENETSNSIKIVKEYVNEELHGYSIRCIRAIVIENTSDKTIDVSSNTTTYDFNGNSLGGESNSIVALAPHIALILRHKPDVIGIKLDEHGWANVDDLIAGVAKTRHFTREMLEEIVATDEKQRYSFSEDGSLIRANQGHSVLVDVELEEKEPPEYLYHGSGEKYVSSINELGLIPKSRLYVHLSTNFCSAEKVGARHGKPVVYKIQSEKMYHDGCKFYFSANGVWLTQKVPSKYFAHCYSDISVIENIIKQIKETFSDEDECDSIEEKIITKYDWECVQEALFTILLDDSATSEEYENVANVFWTEVLDKMKIDEKKAIALLYYRLGDINAPYENNTIWSIVSTLYNLDYANSEYNPLRDDKIIKTLESLGIQVS